MKTSVLNTEAQDRSKSLNGKPVTDGKPVTIARILNEAVLFVSIRVH
jgi:hypothetical protein